MKTVIFAGNSKIEVRDLPIPEPKSGEILLKVGASAICGSEMKTFRSPEGHPTNTGHEFVGTVVANPNDHGPRVGDRIAANIITGCGECDYCRAGDRRFCDQQGYLRTGHAEYVAMPIACCMPLPDDISFDEGVLLGGDTLGVANHALTKAGLRTEETVSVVGCGPVGLGFVTLLGFLGVRTIAVEVTPYRRELAARAGAEVIDPTATDALAAIRELTGGKGADLSIDASGADAGVNLALDAVRKEGRFIFAGAGRKATINPWSQFLEKEITAYGVWYFVDRDYEALLDLYRKGLRVAPLITHRFHLDDAPTAYDLFARGETGKVIFVPEDDPALSAS
jgi:2-desacetyl-2-hydroxyethyl bacteriochlorophyllide A dehydrogenase